MKHLPDFLLKNPVFTAFSDSDLEEASRLASTRSYLKGEKIILYGDVWAYLLLVKNGVIEAVKESGEGRVLRVASFGAGELFWGMAFFHDEAPMPVTLEAREDSSLYLWARQDILPLLFRNGKASWELSRLMAGRMERASEILEGLAFHPVAGRLARLLLENFDTAGDAAISRHLTLDEMAAHIGTTREMVCRALYSFSDKKLIEVTRTEFVLTDRKGLAQMVERG
ncbi:MAG: Crp/Fnr family transcriptional regulator [Anaerolineaceae bacterium]|jgi:CRP/FNR family transcriptional regulator|nr:MAG: Crp/Fnr family transcriptional regulator [Anaerolineaceae bacterium]